jgi:hypothetical protein
MAQPTRAFKTVPRDTWSKMLRLARHLDVGRGGLHDARSGCINLWVSPEDHPRSWDHVEMTAGAFPEPREYLGGIMAELTGDLSEAILTLECTPYERAPSRHLGAYPPPEEDEWEWIARKANELVELAERVIEPPGADSSIFCRFCEAPVPVPMLNDFLDHLVGVHRLELMAVRLGEPTVILTNIGPVEV